VSLKVIYLIINCHIGQKKHELVTLVVATVLQSKISDHNYPRPPSVPFLFCISGKGTDKDQNAPKLVFTYAKEKEWNLSEFVYVHFSGRSNHFSEGNFQKNFTSFTGFHISL
jgi:hypothetical protein